jgi:serine protease Do
MRRIILFLAILAPFAAPLPALAQTEPVRIVNRTVLPATGIFLARAEQRGEWGANLLRSPLAAGATFSIRLGEGSSCRFDVRLVLQGGEELVRRDLDICADRTVEMTGGPERPPPRGTPPVVGGGDRVIPAVPATPR